ncbi:unnamed protein product, partial [Discosporangium mesarthrocarpum]
MADLTPVTTVPCAPRGVEGKERKGKERKGEDLLSDAGGGLFAAFSSEAENLLGAWSHTQKEGQEQDGTLWNSTALCRTVLYCRKVPARAWEGGIEVERLGTAGHVMGLVSPEHVSSLLHTAPTGGEKG